MPFPDKSPIPQIDFGAEYVSQSDRGILQSEFDYSHRDRLQPPPFAYGARAVKS